MASSRIDVLHLVPFNKYYIPLLDPAIRKGTIPFSYLAEARCDTLDYLGQLPRFRFDDGGVKKRHRSLTAVALATVLERAGLRWRVLDPGEKELAWFREQFAQFEGNNPLVVGITTTFMLSESWLRLFIETVRRCLPKSKIVIGGYYYATDTQAFLKLDADVLFVGEGEVRYPQLVKAIRDNKPLHHIPGLYLRRPDGRLDFTGAPPTLDLGKEARPDWRLAAKIEPVVDPEKHWIQMHVETQRGCVFRCEFCTFRALAAPNIMSVDDAVQTIMDTAVFKHAGIWLVDATGSFPHDRFEKILEGLIARGGSPHRTRIFARVTDINERRVELMRRANITELTIGQESGDDRMLRLMRKGAKISQVAPAMRALAGSGVRVSMGFLAGFPGEDQAAIVNTRNLVVNINGQNPDKPVVDFARMAPFVLEDFATVAQKVKKVEGPWRDPSPTLSMDDAWFAALRTIIEMAKVPHAPASGYVGGQYMMESSFWPVSTDAEGRNRHELFHWVKLHDVIFAKFLEHRVFGVPLDRSDFPRIRALLRHPQPKGRMFEARLRVSNRLQTMIIERLRNEWTGEATKGHGPLTALLAGARAYADTGSIASGVAAVKAGSLVSSTERQSSEVVKEGIAAQASTLISISSLKAKSAKLPKSA